MNQTKPLPGQGMYFTAWQGKLILMSICTFGAYELYWFWKNWRLYNERGDKKVWPAVRALFAPFTAYWMFKDIRSSADTYGVRTDMRPGWLAIAYLALFMLYDLPGAYGLISVLTFLPLAVANNLAIETNKKASPYFVENDQFSGWNWLAIVLGGILFCLAVVQAVFPGAFPESIE